MQIKNDIKEENII